MQPESANAAVLLEALQDAMREFAAMGEAYLGRGTRPGRPGLTLSARPFHVYNEAPTPRLFRGSVGLGVIVRGVDDKEYDLVVDVMWDDRRWTITTEAWVESHDGGQRLLRERPERTTERLDECARHLNEAVADLVNFADLVPGKPGGP